MLVDEILDGFGFVGSKVVPDQDDAAPDVAQKVTKKNHELGFRDCTATNQDEKAIVCSYAGNGRNLGPRVAVTQHWRLTTRSPGPRPGWDEAEATFVCKNQRGAESAGFFLMRGQSLATQR